MGDHSGDIVVASKGGTAWNGLIVCLSSQSRKKTLFKGIRAVAESIDIVRSNLNHSGKGS